MEDATLAKLGPGPRGALVRWLPPGANATRITCFVAHSASVHSSTLVPSPILRSLDRIILLTSAFVYSDDPDGAAVWQGH